MTAHLEGKNTIAKIFSVEHLKDPRYISWLNDREVNKYIGRNELTKGVSINEVNEYVENIWKSRSTDFYAIYCKNYNEFIGTAKIKDISNDSIIESIYDLGIMIGNKKYWGRGIATELIKLLSEHAFKNKGARKITSGMIKENIGMVKAFQKCGYINEGIIRKQIKINGSFYDHVLMGCFVDELR